MTIERLTEAFLTLGGAAVTFASSPSLSSFDQYRRKEVKDNTDRAADGASGEAKTDSPITTVQRENRGTGQQDRCDDPRPFEIDDEPTRQVEPRDPVPGVEPVACCQEQRDHHRRYGHWIGGP